MSKSEYYKETIDWSKVKKGDPIEVDYNTHKGKYLVYFESIYEDRINFRSSSNEFNVSYLDKNFCRPLDKSCIVREIDWSKVTVDTKVILKYEGKKEKAHFSHVDDKGRIHTFNNGKTSWTSNGEGASWLHAHEVELAE